MCFSFFYTLILRYFIAKIIKAYFGGLFAEKGFLCPIQIFNLDDKQILLVSELAALGLAPNTIRWQVQHAPGKVRLPCRSHEKPG